jgi:predicted Zn-dependent protease
MNSILPTVAIISLIAGCGKINNQTAQKEGTDNIASNSANPETKDLQSAPPEDDLIGDLLRFGSGLAKSADEIGQEIFGLNKKEQKEVGEALHKRIKQEHTILDDSIEIGRIKKLAAPFENSISRKDLNLQFSIIEADEVNAFSHVGGYIYFNTGLLKIIESDEELQFVVGHEIAHLELGHCEKLITYAVRAKGLGDELGGSLGAESAQAIAGIAYQALSSGFSQDQEFACDAWSYKTMRKSGVSHTDCCAMSRKFVKREKQSSSSEDKSKDPANKIDSEIDAHFRTHPPAEKRLEALEKLK